LPKISGVMAWLLLSGAPAAAQQLAQADINQLSIEDLSKIEITSVSRRLEPLDKAAAAVFVITADDIRRSGARNVPEALRLAPNLQVSQMNGYAYTISARGFASPEAANKLLVLIDGRSIYSPLASTVFWENLDFPIDNVERIEVISGPGGTLYGANAVNGVINIITKNAQTDQGGFVDARAGNNNGLGLLRYGFMPWEGGSVEVHGQAAHTNATDPKLLSDTTRTDWTQDEGGFRVDQTLERDTFMLGGNIYANNTPVTDLEKGRGGSINSIWNHHFADDSILTVQLSADDSSRILLGPPQREDLRTLDFQTQDSTSLGFGDTLVFGGEYRNWLESYFTNGLSFGFAQPTTVIDVADVFAQDEIPLTKQLRLTLGSKLEDNSYSGIDFLPNIRLAWQLNDTDMLWGAISRAVRTPSKIDRELESPGILLPSPDFAAEKLTAYELGYRSQPMADLSLSVSLYYNSYGDLRSDQPTPNTIFPIILENGVAGNTYGTESWANYAIKSWWRLSAGFSWLHKNFRPMPGFIDLAEGQSEGQDPATQAQLRSQMNVLDNWELDAGLREVGKVTQENPTGGQFSLVPAYLETNGRVAWHFAKTEIALSGMNLLHSRHLEANDPSTYAPQYIPRTVILSLQQHF
jgi:iron complex outermembrane receptor protein